MKFAQLVICIALLSLSVVSVSASDDVGQSIYAKSCASCHDSGIMGAPKVGDKPEWSGLIAKGIDDLTDNAINGMGKMPPKGGNMKLTDEEVEAAVSYMMEKSK